MSTRNYSQDDVLVTYGGVPITEFEGEIEITIPEPMWKSKQGAGGAVVRARAHSNLAQIKLSIIHGSPDNAYLAEQARLDYLTGSNAKELLIQDNRGKLLFSSPTAWITNYASFSGGEEAGAREWELEAAPFEWDDGQNESA